MPGKRQSGRTRSAFSDLLFPRRPSRIAQQYRAIEDKKARLRNRGPAIPSNRDYIEWLVDISMLENANRRALLYSGTSRLWQNPFAKPRPRAALARADVWYTAYPISMISSQDECTLAALGREELWSLFEDIGIRGLHTGAMKRAGGLNGWHYTPSVDGHFDRISIGIDPVFGVEKDFRHLCQIASEHGGIVIDDIVPGHTGKGADFRLATMGYRDYPGIYHIIEIDQKEWPKLPDVPPGRDSVNISPEIERQLEEDGYIIGRLQRVIFFEPGVKETNWSVTGPVIGVDGVTRRWVYLHYFKEGQPTINWLDPTFAGMKLVVGDALHSLGTLGSSGLRLDANGFLGIEKSTDGRPAWSEGHPLSVAANQLIAGMVRKVGGFTFQELNLSIDDIKAMSVAGADLSYDFINRPAYHHALATANTEFLQLTLREALSIGIDPAALIHALQNHDELTYELVHFSSAHADDEYEFRGARITGLSLAETIRSELRSAVTGERGPYNLLFSENGIACTTVSFLAAALGYADIATLKPEDIDLIRRAHLLCVMFNAWQPGVFALSGWDLAGALTLDRADVAGLIGEGDTRWINRGAYGRTGKFPEAGSATSGLQRAPCIYAPLPDQLSQPDSFANGLKRILEVRRSVGIPAAHQVDIPAVSNPALLVMVHRLSSGAVQVTVLNFSREPVKAPVRSPELASGLKLRNAEGGEPVLVNARRSFRVSLPGFGGACFLSGPV